MRKILLMTAAITMLYCSFHVNSSLAFSAPLDLTGVTAREDTLEKNDDKVKRQNTSLSGYVSNIYSLRSLLPEAGWLNDNLIHNRLDFNWFISPNLTFSAGMRNRVVTGEMIKYIPDYRESFERDLGWFGLSENLISDSSFLLSSGFDRLFFDYQHGKFSITVGRQRINWGQSLVWNPNDVFNSYSLFDFDYPERPGSDAIRIRYFKDEQISLELAAKVDYHKQKTIAGLFRINKWNYDFQFLAGWMNDQDYVVGTGWSGGIKGAGFRGEITYLYPTHKNAENQDVLVATVSGDYTFPSTLMLQLDFLYNTQTSIEGLQQSLWSFNAPPSSVKNLMFSEFNLYAAATYNITPLLKSNISGILMRKIDGYYLEPSLSYSLSNNAEISLILQHLRLQEEPYKGDNTSVFTRLKIGF